MSADATTRRVTVGMLAHVDAGKTTLCEAMLYRAGEIRRLGRVDHGDAFLDMDGMERSRGITIFSKEAVVRHGGVEFTLLDTPGHVDFAAEMERTLRVLDYAVLVVDANGGIQGHTQTLWRLLARYGIPTFIFVNKMDMAVCDRQTVLEKLKRGFGEGCVAFGEGEDPSVREDVALLDDDEAVMDEFLASGRLSDDRLRSLVSRRLLFPCHFGSALKLDGIDGFLDGLVALTGSDTSDMSGDPADDHGGDFGARVFKISHDAQGSRLTWLKVTRGMLPVKFTVVVGARGATGHGDGADEAWHEKVDQIRLYDGAKFELTDQAQAGMVCALTGLDHTYPGQGLGLESDAEAGVLQPVLTYKVTPFDASQIHATLIALRTLEDEDPLLHVTWVERLQEIHVQLMGAVQLEIVQQMLDERFGIKVEFGRGGILYHETVTQSVEGIGHFEPLRHYAEVHLLLQPGVPGSGMVFDSQCSEDMLARNWQRAVLTHLREKEHLGVLVGAPLTDMRISLVAGRGHEKHTEGGDFREATYRAVRQGLMELKARGACRVLEPWYAFRLEVPSSQVGRAMSDIERMSGNAGMPRSDGELTVLEGAAPVSEMRDYAAEVNAYTHGTGTLDCIFDGYRPCHNAEEIIEKADYDPETDLENTPDSVFCAHGAGYTVKWNRVPDFAHVDSGLEANR